MVLPNSFQKNIWRNWLTYWSLVEKFKGDGYRVVSVLGGDSIDGYHHETTQVMTNNIQQQISHAVQVFQPVKKLSDRVVVIKGTKAHVGNGASADNAIGKELGAVVDAVTGQHSFHVANFKINGVGFNVAHHISGGINNVRRELEQQRIAGSYPDYILRGHVHRLNDTGFAYRNMRGLVSPSWQGKTDYVHTITREVNSVVGGLIVVIEDDGSHRLVDPSETTFVIEDSLPFNL